MTLDDLIREISNEPVGLCVMVLHTFLSQEEKVWTTQELRERTLGHKKVIEGLLTFVSGMPPLAEDFPIYCDWLEENGELLWARLVRWAIGLTGFSTNPNSLRAALLTLLANLER